MRLGDLDALMAKFLDEDADTAAEKEMNQVCRYLIRHTPTIDAVEVVRCGECKHYTRPENWPPEYTKGRCFLDVLERRVHPDDYCSYGERKDGEG